jgi:DNA-binding response OmpR family regulator
MDAVVKPISPAPTILVVEDEDAVRFLFVEILTDQGFDVIEASTGAGALARVAVDTLPALMIIDSGLPDMPGEAVVRLMRRTMPRLKVLFVTGKDANDLAHPLDARTALLMKPFSLGQLVAIVADLVAA